jgi:hypothetical protein
MADKLNEHDDNLLDESYTEFPGYKIASGGRDLGRLSGFFAKFFARRGRKPKHGRLAGDVLKTTDTFENVAGIGVSKGLPKLPQVEYERKRRYKEYEEMDEYPEIGAALDIYGDDSTQKNITGKIFEINTENEMVKESVEDFLHNVRLREFIWDIVRNVSKYGDCFIENIVDLNEPEAGIQRVKVLNPNYISRVENEYGYLKHFLQEMPDPKTAFAPDAQYGGGVGSGKFITLDKEQIVHFRIHTSDPNFYPYGKSILAPGVRAWKSLRLMEDAMLIYRLARAPERRVFYIDVGNLPTSKVEMYMERIKQKFKKEKFWDPQSGGISERYNPLSTDEDFFVPTRAKSNTKIETLPGAQNLGETDDVKYFRDKLLAALKVPKDYIVEKDKSPERKANLSQLDVKFARAVTRMQREIEIALGTLVRRHLRLRKFPPTLVEGVELNLCPPSDMFEKRRLELDEQKTRVVQAVKGLELFPNEWLYKQYYQMAEEEIEKIQDKMKTQQEEAAAMQPDPMMGGMGAPMGGPMGEEGEEGGEEAPEGAEGAEPPTQQPPKAGQ